MLYLLNSLHIGHIKHNDSQLHGNGQGRVNVHGLRRTEKINDSYIMEEDHSARLRTDKDRPGKVRCYLVANPSMKHSSYLSMKGNMSVNINIFPCGTPEIALVKHKEMFCSLVYNRPAFGIN